MALAQGSTSVLAPLATPRAATMAAVVIGRPQPVEIRSVRLPPPGGGQVRVRLEGCGACASKLPVWQGRPYFHYPFEPAAPGHEAWGWVDAVGPEVAGFRAGERVALLSYHAYARYDLASADDVVVLSRARRTWRSVRRAF